MGHAYDCLRIPPLSSRPRRLVGLALIIGSRELCMAPRTRLQRLELVSIVPLNVNSFMAAVLAKPSIQDAIMGADHHYETFLKMAPAPRRPTMYEFLDGTSQHWVMQKLSTCAGEHVPCPEEGGPT